MRRALLSWVSLIALCLANVQAAADSLPFSDPAAGVKALLMPQSGLYYPRNESGQGVVLENLGNGQYFGAYLGYDQAGAPTWLTFNGTFQPTADRDVIAGAPLGELEAVTAKTSEGACYTCAYRAPTVTTAPAANVHIEFLTPSQIRVTMDGATKLMSLPEHTAAKGTPTATVQQDNPELRKLTGVWTLRLRQTINGQTVTKTGRVLMFSVPLSAPLGEQEQHANNRFVYGMYCNDPACDTDLMPVLTAGAAPGQAVRPIVFWNATSRSGQLKVYTQTDAPSGPWADQPGAAVGTMMQNGNTLSAVATAQGSGSTRQDITFDMTPASLWFP